MDSPDNLSARILLKRILITEPPQTPVASSSSEIQSTSGVRRSDRLKKDVSAHKPQDILRRSLKRKMHESVTRISLPPTKRRTTSFVLRKSTTPGPASLLCDADDTPRHILMNILQTEPVKSPVAHEKAAPKEPQLPSARSSISSGRPSTALSGLDLPDVTIANSASSAKGLSRKRPRRSLNVTAFEKRLKHEDDAEKDVDESTDSRSSLCSLSDSATLSLKTPFVDLRSEKRGLQRKIPQRKKITADGFGAAVHRRQMEGLSSTRPVDQALGETAHIEGFSLGLSELPEPELTTDIFNCNTALYAQSDAMTSNFSVLATQDKPTVLASQPQGEMRVREAGVKLTSRLAIEGEVAVVSKPTDECASVKSQSEEDMDAAAATFSQSRSKEYYGAAEFQTEEEAAADSQGGDDVAVVSQSEEEDAGDSQREVDVAAEFQTEVVAATDSDVEDNVSQSEEEDETEPQDKEEDVADFQGEDVAAVFPSEEEDVAQPQGEQIDVNDSHSGEEEADDSQEEEVAVSEEEEVAVSEEEEVADSQEEEEEVAVSQEEEEEVAVSQEEEEEVAVSQEEEEEVADSQEEEEEVADSQEEEEEVAVSQGEDGAVADSQEEEEEEEVADSQEEDGDVADSQEEEEEVADSQEEDGDVADSQEEDVAVSEEEEVAVSEEEEVADSQEEDGDVADSQKEEVALSEEEEVADSQGEDGDVADSQEEDAVDSEGEEDYVVSQSEVEDAADSQDKEEAPSDSQGEDDVAAESQAEKKDVADDIAAMSSSRKVDAAESPTQDNEADSLSEVDFSLRMQSDGEESGGDSKSSPEDPAAKSQSTKGENMADSQTGREHDKKQGDEDEVDPEDDGASHHLGVTHEIDNGEDVSGSLPDQAAVQHPADQDEEWEDEEEDDENSEDFPSKTPAFVRERRNFFHPDPQASPVGVKNIQARTSGTSGGLPGPNPKQVKARKRKSAKEQLCLPKSYLMGVFKHFAKTKVSADVYPVLTDVMEKFFQRMAEDLETYAAHAKRKTVEVEDVELLLKRQGYVNDKVPVEVLIEKYLRMEQRKLLIPIATSGNVVVPKQRR